MKGPAPRWEQGLAALICAAGLLAVAAGHPQLRFPDFIGFAHRAQVLLQGQELVSPLYPAGYPALLRLAQPIAGDVVLAGKGLTLAASMAAALGVIRWLGPWVGVWMVAQMAVLQWGTTEGTDMLAATLGLWAILLAQRGRAFTAGLVVGLGVMVRYTAVAALPVVLLGAGGWWRAALGFALGSAPHWIIAAATGSSPLPDQRANIRIGGGGDGLLSPETLRAWPRGLMGGLTPLRMEWPLGLASLGLLLGALRRDGRALRLLAWGALHLGMVALVFANPRLVLPTLICAALGAAWLLPGRWLALPAIALLIYNGRTAIQPTPEERSVLPMHRITPETRGPYLATSPWFHVRREGWLEGGQLLPQTVGGRPIGPRAALDVAREGGARTVVLDAGRVGRQYPELRPMLRGPVQGAEEVAEAQGWRALEVRP